VPDTTKLRELTGWRALRTLDDIILEVATEVRGAPAQPEVYVAVP